MELIDGNEVASSVIRDLTDRVASFGEVKPRVTFIRVGDDPASISYLRKKEKTAKQIGIRSELKLFPISISQNDLLEEIDKLNANPDVHGILVQAPYPIKLMNDWCSIRFIPAKMSTDSTPLIWASFAKSRKTLLFPALLLVSLN